jgi:hypothetical protein
MSPTALGLRSAEEQDCHVVRHRVLTWARTIPDSAAQIQDRVPYFSSSDIIHHRRDAETLAIGEPFASRPAKYFYLFMLAI